MYGYVVSVGMFFGVILVLEMGWIIKDECNWIVVLCSFMGLFVYYEIIEDIELMF